MSKSDADLISNFLGYTLQRVLVPFAETINAEITDIRRVLMEELGIAGHPSQIGGMALNLTAEARQNYLVAASGMMGIVVGNGTDAPVNFQISGQILTSSGRELMPIANSPPANMPFLKEVARDIYRQISGAKKAQELDEGKIKVHVVRWLPAGESVINFQILETLKKD